MGLTKPSGFEKLHEFSSDDYERMAEIGLLPESGVELIDGIVVQMSPKGDRHGFVVTELNEILTTHPHKKYRVYCDALSLRALPKNTPDPDIALARLTRSYARRRPTPAEIALIIEVANTSYDYDTGKKKAIYAKAGIPEYWVFDVRSGRDAVEIFDTPENGEYHNHRTTTLGSVIAPREYPEVLVELDRAFGIEEIDA